MKLTITAFSAAALGFALPLTAQVTETKTETEVTESSNGSISESKTTTVKTFNPEVRTRAVQYFDPYKASPHGLPPAFAARLKMKEIPAAWRTARVEPGVVIVEKERPWLVEAPPELIKVLPPPAAEVRYYVAGSNVVAVNKTYQVVDSIHIPSIKLEAVEVVEEVEPVEKARAVEKTETVVEEVKTVRE